MHEAAQHRGADGQDEKAERAGEDVEDEAVLRALTALLQRDGTGYEGGGGDPPTCSGSLQTLMRALTTSISPSFILLITTWSSSSLTMFGWDAAATTRLVPGR